MKGMEACKLKWKEESPELTFQCLQLFIFSTQSSWNAMRKLWFPLEPDGKLQNEFMTLADSQFWGSLATSEAWHGTVFCFWRVCWFLHFYLKTPLLFQITLFVCDFPVIRGARWNLRNLSLSLSLFLSLLYHTSIISSCRQYLVYLLSMFHVFLCPWICLYLCVFRKAWDGEYDGYDGYDYEGYWNDWSSSWSEWGSSWQSRDRRVGGQCYRRWHLRMPCNTMQRKMAHDCTTTLQHELHVERTGRLQKVLRKVLRKVIRKALHGITQSPRLATKRTSKRIQNPVTSCNPVSHVAQRKEAWQEWDWEEDLWDEASEWDEYITVKEWILKRLMLEVKGNCLNGEGGATWCWDVVCITNHFDFLMNTVLFWPDLLSQKGNKLSQTPWHLVPLIAAYTGLHCSCWA